MNFISQEDRSLIEKFGQSSPGGEDTITRFVFRPKGERLKEKHWKNKVERSRSRGS